MGSATIASPVPTATSSSLRRIIEPPLGVVRPTPFSIRRAREQAARNRRSRCAGRRARGGAPAREGKNYRERRENLHGVKLTRLRGKTTGSSLARGVWALCRVVPQSDSARNGGGCPSL